MKKTLIASIFAVAILSIGIAAASQSRPLQGKGQHNNVQRQRNQDESDKLMIKGAKQCMQAHRVMQSALPIYNGHRVKAMEYTKLAVQEVRKGLRFDKTHHEENGQDLNKQINSVNKMTENPQGKYTDQQIQQSNRKMQHAADILTKAKADLKSANKDYGGHRANAIRLVDMALNEISQALSTVRVNP